MDRTVSPDMLTRLNVATRRWHLGADEPWLRLVDANVNWRTYLAHMMKMYGIEAPFESACAYTPQLANVIEAHQLTRAGFIAQDLLELGLMPSEVVKLPQCPISAFADVSEALGWLYVMERSTMLYARIRKHLLGRIPALAPTTSYLTAFEAVTTDGYWHRFGEALDRVARTPQIASQIIDAAHTAFQCTHRWFAAPGAPRRGVLRAASPARFER